MPIEFSAVGLAKLETDRARYATAAEQGAFPMAPLPYAAGDGT